METVRVAIRQLPGSEDLPLPAYESEHASGLDLRAAIDGYVKFKRGARMAVPTGVCIALPPGLEGQVRPRSGWALRAGVTMINSPGTIDADYRGEIKVLLVNLGDEHVVINRGDRIAQLVIAPVARVEWAPVPVLDESIRGDGGFGHTGR